MNVGQLKKYLEDNNVSDDTKIFTERVEDIYYVKHNWNKTSVFEEGYAYYQHKQLIERAKSGEFNNKEDYPLMTQKLIDDILASENKLESFKEEFTPIQSVYHREEKNALFIKLHY